MSEQDNLPEQPDQVWIEGAISIQAVLSAGSRPLHELAISTDKGDHETLMLERRIKQSGQPVRRVSPADMDELTKGSTHGGIAARVGQRTFMSLDQLAAKKPTWVTMIDGVEDPFNFGQAVRALYAAGCDALVVRPRNWMSAAGTVARSSAGASELMTTAVADTAELAAQFFKNLGMTVAATSGEREARSLFNCELVGPLFLLIGGERRGITRSAMRLVDWTIRIPYGRVFANSLGTTGATAVFAFEIMRQRMRAGPNVGQKPEHAERGFAQRTRSLPREQAPPAPPARPSQRPGGFPKRFPR